MELLTALLADHAVSASTVYLIRSLGTVYGVAITSAIVQTTLSVRLPDALGEIADKPRVRPAPLGELDDVQEWRCARDAYRLGEYRLSTRSDIPCPPSRLSRQVCSLRRGSFTTRACATHFPCRRQSRLSLCAPRSWQERLGSEAPSRLATLLIAVVSCKGLPRLWCDTGLDGVLEEGKVLMIQAILDSWLPGHTWIMQRRPNAGSCIGFENTHSPQPCGPSNVEADHPAMRVADPGAAFGNGWQRLQRFGGYLTQIGSARANQSTKRQGRSNTTHPDPPASWMHSAQPMECCSKSSSACVGDTVEGRTTANPRCWAPICYIASPVLCIARIGTCHCYLPSSPAADSQQRFKCETRCSLTLDSCRWIA